nr:unnamed protein product [Callosobruchus chinensis]
MQSREGQFDSTVTRS